jgi:hypothetical protein
MAAPRLGGPGVGGVAWDGEAWPAADGAEIEAPPPLAALAWATVALSDTVAPCRACGVCHIARRATVARVSNR